MGSGHVVSTISTVCSPAENRSLGTRLSSFGPISLSIALNHVSRVTDQNMSEIWKRIQVNICQESGASVAVSRSVDRPEKLLLPPSFPRLIGASAVTHTKGEERRRSWSPLPQSGEERREWRRDIKKEKVPRGHFLRFFCSSPFLLTQPHLPASDLTQILDRENKI